MANALKTLIERRLAELGRSARAASLIGDPGNPELVRGVLRQADTHHPRVDTLEKLALAVDLPVEDLLAALGVAREPVPVRGDVRVAPPHLVPEPNGLWPRDIPVMGTAAGSAVGGYDFRFEGGIIDYVRRPPSLAGARDVYAIFVTGSSMEPEHRPGDVRLINPHRPPAIGDTVIIQTVAHENAAPEAYIKHLVRRTSDRIVARQLNPDATIEFKRSTVTAIHKVLSMNDLLGV